MLVLTRKLKEKLIIGNNIVIEILDVKGKQVRLGITAPSTVKVLREELFVRINERIHNTIFTTEKLTNGVPQKILSINRKKK